MGLFASPFDSRLPGCREQIQQHVFPKQDLNSPGMSLPVVCECTLDFCTAERENKAIASARQVTWQGEKGGDAWQVRHRAAGGTLRRDFGEAEPDENK